MFCNISGVTFETFNYRSPIERSTQIQHKYSTICITCVLKKSKLLSKNKGVSFRWECLFSCNAAISWKYNTYSTKNENVRNCIANDLHITSTRSEYLFAQYMYTMQSILRKSLGTVLARSTIR